MGHLLELEVVRTILNRTSGSPCELRRIRNVQRTDLLGWLLKQSEGVFAVEFAGHCVSWDAAGKKIDGAAADTKEDVHVGPLRVEKGRPDLKELLSNIRAQHGDVASKDMAFFVCGPERVVHATREVAVEFSVPAHSETFYL